MDQFRVVFLPDAAEALVPAGATLLAAAAKAHMAVDAPCGDRGICGKCKVQLVGPLPSGESRREGPPSPESSGWPALDPPTLHERTLIAPEDLGQGWRLACQARVVGDVVVRVPERALKPAVVPLAEVEPCPSVRKLHVKLAEPTIQDPTSDLTRLRNELAGEVQGFQIDLPLLRHLPRTLITASHDVTAVVAGWGSAGVAAGSGVSATVTGSRISAVNGRAGLRLLALEPGDTSSECYGLAVDLGTTSVVAMLADLRTGKLLGVESRLNGQANYGADVVSRINHASSCEEGLVALQAAAVETINSALATLLERTGIDRQRVYEAVVVGNTCMNHLLLGIDPRSLALAPYQPVVVEPVSCRAAELGLGIHPEGVVTTLPNVAGFVGGDTVAVILATAMHRSEEIRLALDLGTNGEIALGNRDRVLACSTAAGPAFEGARISCGMRATGGAIERVWIDGGDVKLQVIGDGAALGVCGSGLLDAVAQMRAAQLLDGSGRLLPPEKLDSSVPSSLLRRRLHEDGVNGFVLARRGRRLVVLTQADVRELQLAKGAIRAGISILLKEFGIGESEISEVLLAGAFGSYVNPASARAIGLVPPLPIERITAVGNAAGQGALMALLSTDLREEATRIARSVEYVELSGHPDFMDRFMDAMALDASSPPVLASHPTF